MPHVLPALLLTAVTAAGTTLVAAPAHAVGTCDLTVPSQITVRHTRTVLYGSVSGDCANTDGFGAWEMWKDGGDPSKSSYVYFNETTDGPVATLDLYDFNLQLGRNTFHPDGAGGSCSEATNYDDCDVVQNSPSTVIRLASASGVAARRVGRVITLTGSSSVYSPGADRYVRRAARGQFQYRSRGGAWHVLRTVTTNRSGAAAMRAGAVKGRQFRFVTSAAGSWWSSASRVVAP